MKKATCLYLAVLDPTTPATGTSQRGRLFLNFLADRYEVHLLHMQDRDQVTVDEGLRGRLASIATVPYSRWSYFLFSRRLLAELDELTRRLKPDFIFADFEKAGFYARLVGGRHGVPYVYSSHNVEYQRYLDLARAAPLRYALTPWIWWVERQACAGALLTIAISEPDADVLQRWVRPGRLMTLPCAFDEESFPPSPDGAARRPVVLMVGNYRNPGNSDGALAAFREVVPAVLARRPDAIFRFVGKHLPEEIRHPNVEAAGFVDDLQPEYAQAAVVIAPIRMGGGIKIKVIEALAAGRPLVATPKAMEGIPADGLANLWVAPIADFPRLILDALERRPATATENWPIMRDRFGVRRQLAAFADRLEALLADGPETPARAPRATARPARASSET